MLFGSTSAALKALQDKTKYLDSNGKPVTGFDLDNAAVKAAAAIAKSKLEADLTRFTESDGADWLVEFVATDAGIAAAHGRDASGAGDYLYITIDKDDAGTDIMIYRQGKAGNEEINISVPFDKGDGVTIGKAGGLTTPIKRVYYFV